MPTTDSTRDPSHRPIGRPRWVLAAAAVLALVALTAAPVPAPATTAAPGTVPSTRPSPLSRGETLYRQSCASCHGPQGQGSQRGPALIDVGPASVDFQLSTGRMPLTQRAYEPKHTQPAFSAADIDALVRHVASFGGAGPPIPHVGPGNVRDGRELFLANCAACHSATGAGSTLTGGQVAPKLNRANPVQVAEAVRVGPGLMPAFPDSVLTDQEVNAIVAYVGVLQGDRGRLDRGGTALGRLGPLSEGIVAWVVGLGLIVLAVRGLGSRVRR